MGPITTAPVLCSVGKEKREMVSMTEWDDGRMGRREGGEGRTEDLGGGGDDGGDGTGGGVEEGESEGTLVRVYHVDVSYVLNIQYRWRSAYRSSYYRRTWAPSCNHV